MILIADSGSTKTEWCLVQSNGERKTFQTIGMNPYFIDQQGVNYVLIKDLHPYIDQKSITKLYFYGSGCSSITQNETIASPMEDFFKNADIYIEHDLLGAARSLCQREPGIASILGTGSNSCLYDGLNIIENVPSVGYVLGDEGAGSYIGKQLISLYLTGDLPSNLAKIFEETYHPDLNEVLDLVYKKPFPNRYLASYTRFLSDNIHDAFAHNLVKDAFLAFFRRQIMKYTDYQKVPVHFTGSVSYYFQEILKETASEVGIHVGRIATNPMEGLIQYHTS